MKALCWHGKGDIRCDTVDDPTIVDGQGRDHQGDKLCHLRVRSAPYDGYMPTMEKGDVLGHEPMGEVVEVGKAHHKFKVGRPGRGAVHHLLRRMLLLPARALLALRPIQPERRRWPQGDGPVAGRAVRLFPHAGRVRRRPGRVSAGAVRRCRPDQGPRRAARRAGAVPVRHLPDRLHGRRECRHRAGRHRRRLGLRAGRPVRHPERLDARRRPGDRHRPGARTAGDGARARQGRDASTSAT